MPLVFQTGVREEIDDAYGWYENQQKGLGEDFLTEVQATMDRIILNPELHSICYKTVRHVRLRRFPYAVYYRMEPLRITVIAVHHAKRDPRHWRHRL